MSTVKSKKLQVGTDASASNNFTIYQPAVPDGTLRIGVGNADSPTEIARLDSTGIISGVANPIKAFRAYKSGATQGIGTNTWTKITLETETFDTDNLFASSRFTPDVEGYYQFNGSVYFNNNGWCLAALYKNGSQYSTGANHINNYSATVSALVYMNGTTDYVELYGNSVSGYSVVAGVTTTYFDGILVKNT